MVNNTIWNWFREPWLECTLLFLILTEPISAVGLAPFHAHMAQLGRKPSIIPGNPNPESKSQPNLVHDGKGCRFDSDRDFGNYGR